MRRHINVFVAKNFPDVSELDSSFYPSEQALSSLMYRAMILHRVPTQTGKPGKPGKWEGIFQSGKSQGILIRLEKSGKSQGKSHKILESQGISDKYYYF